MRFIRRERPDPKKEQSIPENPKPSHEEETVKKDLRKTPVPKIQETKMDIKSEKEEATRTIEKSRKQKSIPEPEEKNPRRKDMVMRAVSLCTTWTSSLSQTTWQFGKSYG